MLASDLPANLVQVLGFINTDITLKVFVGGAFAAECVALQKLGLLRLALERSIGTDTVRWYEATPRGLEVYETIG